MTDVATACDGGPHFYGQDRGAIRALGARESFGQAVFFDSGAPSRSTITAHWRDADGDDCSRNSIITR